MNEIVQVRSDMFGDDFECECGNTVTDSGFHSCNEKGIEMEPNAGEWKGHYVCGQCEQVFLLEVDWV
jgi:hypothetical protein